MTIDQILHFFSQHNVAIIEGLVAAIILLGLFVGYRGFFGKKDADSGLGGGLDSAQLEKTLQKILDSQGHAPKTGDEALAAAFKDGAAGHGESPEEVQQLKVSLSENIKELEVIRAELQIAEKKVAELQANPPAGGGDAAPAAAVDTSALDNKIKDLEARLAEYEIISEDIADLSRYKEENEQLKSEITGLKQAPPAAAAPAAPAPAPTPAAPVAEAAPLAPTPEPAPTPAPEVAAEPGITEADVDAAIAAAEAEATPAAAEPAPEVAATEAASAESESIIDDELMKEFAAAVENQKKDLDSVAEKAGKGEAAAGKSTEDSQLMDEFENFVNKKS
ncbi:hypothetical protein [Bdellovibrio sp. KM01]|uniref:hypothetical protein n=1 Tax=Bdellovibrio sp. KM01 TaxID=2748865 RepID=UPI0015E90204|nr:hypothetical protein [Bdellovibrio sp. KM01]QLY26560.1 hypothetical protein HW988_05960 [Bdellovibrio sp. KM01]